MMSSSSYGSYSGSSTPYGKSGSGNGRQNLVFGALPIAHSSALVSWVMVSLFIIHHTGAMGIWFVGAVSQALLGIVSIYTYTLVSDMPFYGLAQRTLQCQSLSKWLKVELILMIVAFCVVAFSDPSPLHLLTLIYFGYLSAEMASHFEISQSVVNTIGRRAVSATDSLRESKQLSATMKAKLAFHLVFLFLMLGYVGAHVNDAHTARRLMEHDDDYYYASSHLQNENGNGGADGRHPYDDHRQFTEDDHEDWADHYQEEEEEYYDMVE